MNLTDPRTGQEVRIFEGESYWAEVTKLSDCEHQTTELRRFTASNGATSIWAQCLRCGRKRGSAVKVSNHRSYPAADLTIESTFQGYVGAQKRAIDIKYIDRQLGRRTEWWGQYTAYLQTAAWAAKRQKVLVRAKGICEGCGDHQAAEVHHLSYRHVMSEFLFELVALCEHCHDRIHSEEGVDIP